MGNTISDQAQIFHARHPVCDMLGLNLTHPRFLIDHIDLGVCQDTTCRGDFIKYGLPGVGFSENDTAKIMGGNYLRILRTVLPR